MKSCLLCPKGTRCRGYVLHLVILKLLDAMETGEGADAIARELSREDMKLIADFGNKARETCWSKAFVLTIAKKIVGFATDETSEARLRAAAERLVVTLHRLFAKLPNGVRVDLGALAMDVYNQAAKGLEEKGTDNFVPANILGQACVNISRKRH